jgi:SAM-dependent methyltransferase
MGKSNSLPPAGHYNANYGNFQTELYAQVRREAFGEDIGQNSWLTSDEQDRFLEWLDLSPGKTLLDVACGAGGPALRIVASTGCSVVGIDVHEEAITTASSLAAQRGLAELAEFRSTDATGPLPFSDATFDAISCIDAINHFSDRSRVIAEWTPAAEGGWTTVVHRSHHSDRSADERGNRDPQFGRFLSVRSARLRRTRCRTMRISKAMNRTTMCPPGTSYSPLKAQPRPRT